MIQFLNETAKDNFVQTLINAGLNYTVKAVGSPDKYQVAYVAFSLEDVALIAEGKKHPYTFADPEKYAIKNGVVRVECEDGRQKPVYVTGVEMKTVKEMFDIAHNLGRKKLSKVINKIM